MSDSVKIELMLRIQRLLALEPDHSGVPDSRFNKSLTFKTATHMVLIRSKRRGDLVVDICSRRTQVRKTVLSNCVGHRKLFDPHNAEHWVLPILRKHMILDDLANV